MDSPCIFFTSNRKHCRRQVSMKRVCLPVAALVLSLVRVSQLAVATPRNLRDIFIGRCEEYQEVIYPEPFINKPKNCSSLYELFYKAFAFKDPCDVPVENYNDFVTASEHDIETLDKVMYWSGSVYPLVYEYTANKRRYITIRDILSGYVIRNIDAWCGQEIAPGINNTDCPPWGSCTNQATPTYWKAISENFAKRVEGHVDVLLNGSSGAAYRNTSTFSAYELANLDSTRNPSLSVLLIHNIDSPGSFKETCSNGTLVNLRIDVESKNMSYECRDDPIELLHFQCVDYKDAAVCQHLAFSSATSIRCKLFNLIRFESLLLVLMFYTIWIK